MRALGLIVARGGSKGIPRKNLRPLAGRPLLEYTAEAALCARRLSSVVLSTEDPEIAAVGERCGVEVPFTRPAELARDETPGFEVVRHALAWMEEHRRYCDAVCVLQPTSPLRRPEDIDACVDLLERERADAVVSVRPVPAEHNPHWVFFQAGDGTLRLSTGEKVIIPRRQDLPAAYHREGSVYVTTRDTIMVAGTLYGDRLLGYVIEGRETVNIDTLEDWARAEALLAARGVPLAARR